MMGVAKQPKAGYDESHPTTNTNPMAKRHGALGSTKKVKHPRKTKKRRAAKLAMLASRKKR